MFPLSLLLAGAALAYEAEPVDLHLSHETTLMDGAVIETGYLPDDTAGVNFALVANQVADVEMDALANLSWPEIVTLHWSGVPGTGVLSTLASLGTQVSFHLDLWGYEWEGIIDERTIEVAAQAFFDPLVLADSDPSSVTVSGGGEGLEAFDISYTPLSGVTLSVPVELSAAVSTTFEGLRVEQDDGTVLEGETDGAVLEIPPDGELDVSSTYVGSWASDLDLVITPSIEVCVDVVGCYEVASFDIPVDFNQVEIDEDPFEPVDYSFELPILGAPDESHDFGEVEIGTRADWELALDNLGSAYLEGTAAITGSGYFEVYPDTVLAEAQGWDGLVVSFQPEEPGEYTAELVLSTNDPSQPSLTISLHGTGVIPDTGEELAVIETETGCGCGASPQPLTALPLLLSLPLVLLRRRGDREG